MAAIRGGREVAWAAAALSRGQVVRQAQRPFADDVALDLAGPAPDGQGGGEQEPVVPEVYGDAEQVRDR